MARVIHIKCIHLSLLGTLSMASAQPLGVFSSLAFVPYFFYHVYMKFLLKLLVSALAVLIAAYILPGVFVDSYVTALIVAIVLGILNAFVRPVLVVLTFPITVLTLGIFYLIINAAMIYAATLLVPGFIIEPLWMTLVFGIVVSLVNSFLGSIVD